MREKFIVAFGNAEDLVDGFDPGSRKRLFVDDRREDGTEGFAQPQNAEQDSINGLGFRVEERAKARGARERDQAGIDKKGDELVPGEVMCGGREIGKIECHTTSDK